MKLKSVFPLVVTLLVVIVLSTACIIPIVQAAQNGVTTEENNTNVPYRAVTGSSLNAIITVADGVITSDGIVVNSILRDIMLADNFEIYVPGGGLVDIYDYENDLRLSSVNSISITIASGVVSYTYNSTDYTVTLEGTVFIVSQNGDYGAFSSAVEFNLSIDENVTFTRPRLSSNYFATVTGTIDNLEVQKILVWDTVNSKYTEYTGDYQLTVSGYELSEDGHSYIISPSTAVTLTTTISDSPVTWQLHGEASTTFAPIKYKTTDEGSPMYALLGVIPLLVLLIPVLMIVRSLSAGRD